jgi:hypothetical protein
MRLDQIHVGGEYAVKSDLSRKGELPMGVARAKVLAKGVELEVRRYSQSYGGGHKKTVKNGVEIEVLQILPDPRWSGRGREGSEGRIGRGPMEKWVRVGDKLIIEGGHDFVAPWNEYAADRAAIDNAKAEREAAQWEARERQKLLGERLRALGFSTREHADVWKKKGYKPEADYTERGGLITTEALERLVTMAEASTITTPPRGKPVAAVKGDDWDDE